MLQKKITDNREGVFLDSGRYFHYFGNFVLSNEEWSQFNGAFLMPCILVSPRYIGHRLINGYNTLRLTNDNAFKTKIPEVVEIIE